MSWTGMSETNAGHTSRLAAAFSCSWASETCWARAACSSFTCSTGVDEGSVQHKISNHASTGSNASCRGLSAQETGGSVFR
eukprot:553919-Pelagomonas_calceolata.AAC.2